MSIQPDTTSKPIGVSVQKSLVHSFAPVSWKMFAHQLLNPKDPSEDCQKLAILKDHLGFESRSRRSLSSS